MRLQHIFYYTILFVLSLSTATVNASSENNILFSLQRTTYIEGERSTSIGLRNAENSPYLVQAGMQWLDYSTGKKDLNKKEEIPFIITPPLYKLVTGNYYEWRIFFNGNSKKLPQDRESVYLARLLFIPSVELKNENYKTGINMAVLREFNFKVYYRPKEFAKMTIESVQDKVTFKRVGNQLIVSNQSPLFLSIDKLMVNTTKINDDELIKPLPPLGEQQYQLPDNLSTTANITIKWNLLDENSFSLKEHLIEIK